MCVSGGRKCSFFGKFGVLCFLETPVVMFALLPYYWRNIKVWRNAGEVLSKKYFYGLPSTKYSYKSNELKENQTGSEYSDFCFCLIFDRCCQISISLKGDEVLGFIFTQFWHFSDILVLKSLGSLWCNSHTKIFTIHSHR